MCLIGSISSVESLTWEPNTTILGLYAADWNYVKFRRQGYNLDLEKRTAVGREPIWLHFDNLYMFWVVSIVRRMESPFLSAVQRPPKTSDSWLFIFSTLASIDSYLFYVYNTEQAAVIVEMA